MSENRENSVLFSLRELRTIEEERIQEEKDAHKRAEEEKIRQQMEAERRAQQEAEAKRQAQEDAERREREERERLAREERMRVEAEAERARVEAQARLEQERLQKEMEIRAIEASKKFPTFLVVTSLILVVLMAGFGYWAWTTGEEADAKERRAKAALAAYQEEVKKAQKDIDEAIAEKEEAYKALLNNKDLEDKERLQAILEQKEKDLKAKRAALKALREREAKKEHIRREKAKRVNVKCDPSDPLCGL
jgi:hypothetical protein